MSLVLRRALNRSLPWLGLALVLMLAAWLRFARLGQFDNQYYTATVASMLSNWHNFFFASFDPGGMVSVDKPPLAFWLESIPAALWGVSGFSVSLVHALAGLASVVLLYALLRPAFGKPAALLAVLALAVIPASVAMDSRNEPDSIVSFQLLLAAFLLVRAANTGSLRWLLASAVVVGLGFNTKMGVALVPVPVFMAYYVLAAPGVLRLRLTHVVLALTVMAVVSLSWVSVVAATPADRRPYVGSTSDNSMWTLVVEYNGLRRFGSFIRPRQPSPPVASGPVAPGIQTPPGGLPSPPPGGPPPSARVTGLFTSPLSDQLGGLLPVAVLGLGVAALRWLPRGVFRHPHKWLTQIRKAAGGQVLLWGGWLVTGMLVFGLAAATTTHPYYLNQLAAPAVAVLAIGLVSAWHRYRHRARLGWTLPLAIAVGTAYQAYLFRESIPAWAQATLILVAATSVGILSLALSARATRAPLTKGAAVAGCLVLLIVPLALSQGQIGAFVGARPPLGATGYRPPLAGAPVLGPAEPRWVEAIGRFLSTQGDQGALFAVGTVRASEAAPFIIRGIPAVAIGGFSGTDPVFTVESFQAMAREGKLRYFLLTGGAGQPGPGPQAAILNAIRRTWRDVSLAAGLPPGTLYRYPGPPGK